MGATRFISDKRIAAFLAGILSVFIALASALDDWSTWLLSAHMVQHLLLAFVAPPLLLLGAPFWPMWRALPLAARRSTLGWAIRRRWPRRIAADLGRALSHPVVAWLIFALTFTAWHIPAFYDAALATSPIHHAEHATLLVAGLLFWAQVIPSAPLATSLSYPLRGIFVGAIALLGNMLDTALMFSTRPLYAYYASHPLVSAALTPLEDQHIAGGVMEIFSATILFGAVMILLGLWLRADEARDLPTVSKRGVHSKLS